MKNRFIAIIAVLFVGVFTLSSCETQKEALRTEGFQQAIDSETTIILVRHAEKILKVKNPDLTEIGKERAEDLEYFLRNVDIDVVYSSNYKRTMQTAGPVAKAKGLEIINYDARNLGALVDKIFLENQGKTVLVVGHSNTTPEMANILSGTRGLKHFDESVYDNILIVTAYEKGVAEVLQLKYGAY